MGIGNLRGVAARILTDRRDVVNPFGIRDSQGRLFTVKGLLRGNADEWVRFITDNELQDPAQVERRKKRIKLAMMRGRKGGQRKTSLKATEDRVMDEIAEDVATTTIDHDAAQAKLARKKEGAARILFSGGFALDDDQGNPLDLSTEEGRLYLLTYNHDEATGAPIANSNEFLLDEHGETLLDDDKQPIENPYRDMLFGDSILAWLEDEAEELELYYQAAEQAILGNSKPTPLGSPANGSDSTPETETPK